MESLDLLENFIVFLQCVNDRLLFLAQIDAVHSVNITTELYLCRFSDDAVHAAGFSGQDTGVT
jgi:hypothetical protein